MRLTSLYCLALPCRKVVLSAANRLARHIFPGALTTTMSTATRNTSMADDLDAHVAERHELAVADLARLAQFCLAIDAHGA